ncbi:hypothetical protein AAF712_014910 [Marasmius tenuissimus]|uniref:F-box domain-containing protein n=1 Tax=Marasmius tenuissimus TaxID=585030 RepID=A0ABR2ZAW7_9AGAR|nr:hypothetical protein PM082_011349 [Marasmius tenuissimus]
MISSEGDLECKLPFELNEIILGVVDHNSLLSCSLVCRSWLPTCRSRLFNHTESNRRYTKLVSLLDSKYQTITKFTKEVAFTLDAGAHDAGTHPVSIDLQRLIVKMRNKSDLFPSLQKLTIVCKGEAFVGIPLHDGTFAQDLITIFGHARELELRLKKEGVIPLIRFICSFPRLEFLKVNSGCFRCDDDEFVDSITGPYTLPASLRTLLIGGRIDDLDLASRSRGIRHFHRWLRTGLPENVVNLSIHKVLVGGRDIPHEPDFQPYLARCYHKLQWLHIGFDTQYVTSPNDTESYDLSLLNRLELLAISLRNIFRPEDTGLLDMLLAMLKTLTSPIRAITLIVSGRGFSVLASRWRNLDALLASNTFATASIEIVIPLTSSENEEGDDLIRAMSVFSKCDEQGRLTVIRAPFTVTLRETNIENDTKYFEDDGLIDWVMKRS